MTTAPTVTLTGVNLIGNDDVAATGTAFRATDPASGAALEPVYHQASASDIDRVTTLAWEAFATFRQTTFAQRAAFLESIADEIEALGSTLTERVHAETGIPTARILGETARTTGQLRMFADVVREGSWTHARLDAADPDRAPLPKPDLRQREVPVGPVAVFAASNFPLAFSVAGGDTAAALAAGAPVIVKAHPAHPGTSELVGRAVRNAVRTHGLPEGTFGLIHGPGHEVGSALATDPRIRAIGFTGSRQGGLALISAAAARPVPIPVYAEMSSVNPVFVLPGALAERGSELGAAYIASMNVGVGQLCTSPGLLFLVDGPGADDFVQSATDAVSATVAAPMLSPALAAAFAQGVSRVTDNTHVAVAARGTEDSRLACPAIAQLFVTTAEQFLADHLQDEIFGPASVIVRIGDAGLLTRIVEALEGQLTATVHAAPSDYEMARPLLDHLELLAGRVLFNGWPTGVEVGHAMIHGGPFPATSAPATTSVGSRAIERFLRPVAYQNVPEELLPTELRTDNPLGIPRRIDGTLRSTD
ncbi:aldehyde dehydrogenase (NADP(+)) [Nocardia sp. NPDC049190]|uniref:aldehyde dehydrogenase (NADP(+)) n=1 Tax=Nocardia sp. NPDC049190 TaxID=3155650 RepID=UPI003411D8F2